jgi:hypothetical protein
MPHAAAASAVGGLHYFGARRAQAVTDNKQQATTWLRSCGR